MEKVKKPIYKKWWFWVIIVVVVFAIAAGGSGSDKKDSKKNSVAGTEQTDNKDAKTKDSDAKDAEPEEDLSAVETEYTLGAGYYTAGIDLPVGKCNLTAVSGNGNINSSNLLKGGVNEMFGVDDGNDLYESSFNGLKMKENVVFHISGDVVVQVSYTEDNLSRTKISRKAHFSRVTEVVECRQMCWNLHRMQHICSRYATKILICIGHFSVEILGNVLFFV